MLKVIKAQIDAMQDAIDGVSTPEVAAVPIAGPAGVAADSPASCSLLDGRSRQRS